MGATCASLCNSLCNELKLAITCEFKEMNCFKNCFNKTIHVTKDADHHNIYITHNNGPVVNQADPPVTDAVSAAPAVLTVSAAPADPSVTDADPPVTDAVSAAPAVLTVSAAPADPTPVTDALKYSNAILDLAVVAGSRKNEVSLGDLNITEIDLSRVPKSVETVHLYRLHKLTEIDLRPLKSTLVVNLDLYRNPSLKKKIKFDRNWVSKLRTWNFGDPGTNGTADQELIQMLNGRRVYP